MALVNKTVLCSGKEYLKDKHKHLKMRLDVMRNAKNNEDVVDDVLGPMCDRMIDEIIAECVQETLTVIPTDFQPKIPTPAKPAYKPTVHVEHNSGKRGRKTPVTNSGKQASTTICPNCDAPTKVLEFISHLEFCMFNEKQGSQRVINNLKRKSSVTRGYCGKKNPRRGANQSQALDSTETPSTGFSYSTSKKKGKHSKSPK